MQNVVQHGAVLAGMNDGDIELFRTTLEFVDNYSHLNGFRSGSQYCNGSAFHSTHLWTGSIPALFVRSVVIEPGRGRKGPGRS
jgi:hypothetical protein